MFTTFSYKCVFVCVKFSLELTIVVKIEDVTMMAGFLISLATSTANVQLDRLIAMAVKISPFGSGPQISLLLKKNTYIQNKTSDIKSSIFFFFA